MRSCVCVCACVLVAIALLLEPSTLTRFTFFSFLSRRSPQTHREAHESQSSMSQETLYTLAETISAHLSNLGDVLYGIVPTVNSVDEASSDMRQRPTPSEITLKAHLQSLQNIEQKIGQALDALT